MSDWCEKALADVCPTIRAGGTPASDRPDFYGGDIPFVTIEDITRAGRLIESTARSLTMAGLNSSAAWVVPPGHILFSMYATLGKVVVNAVPVATNQAILSLKSDSSQLDLGLLFYALQFMEPQIRRLSAQTTQANLSAQVVRRIFVRYPRELPQQRRIAEILGTVDEAIEQTEALIAKQQQVKAGLMHDLFTRGLTPDGQLRPTRTEAPDLYHETPLGWLPKEWPVESLGVLAEIVSGVTLSAKTEAGFGIQVPYLRVANVQDGYLDLSEIKTVRVSSVQLEKLRLRAGDVLMNEGGDFDKLGRGTVWNEEISPCIHQNHVFRVRPRTDRLRSRYLAFWSQSTQGKKFFVLNSKQSTNLASINSMQLHRFPVVLPKLDEQREIETRILAQTDITAAETAHLGKLCQLRQGLMQALLTPPR